MKKRQARSPRLSEKVGGIAGLRVSLCCEPDARLNDWIRELQRARVEPSHCWPPPRRLSAGMDILICDYLPNVADILPWETGIAQAAFVLLLPQNGYYEDKAVIGAAPHCVLQKPFSGQLIRTTAMVAWSQYRYERRLQERIARLDENLKALRDVERAKHIIMSEKKVNEEAAYRHLRDLAMRRRSSVAALAAEIIQSPENIGKFTGTELNN